MNKLLLLSLITLFSVKLSAQVGINTTNPHSSSALEIQSDKKGLLIPRLVLNSLDAQLTSVPNASSLMVYNLGSSAVPEGFYFWDSLKWLKFSTETSQSDFIYMPSVVLPTFSGDAIFTQDATNYTFENDIFSVKLYNLFSKQFTTPVASSASNLAAFVKSAADYDYFVTSADASVFTDVKVNAAGVLSYKVAANTILKAGSFMNIVLKRH